MRDGCFQQTESRTSPSAEGRRAPGTIQRWRDLPRDTPPSSSPPAAGPESSSPDLQHKQEALSLSNTRTLFSQPGGNSPPMTLSMACSKCFWLMASERWRAAIRAASLQTLAMSAPGRHKTGRRSSKSEQGSSCDGKNVRQQVYLRIQV